MRIEYTEELFKQLFNDGLIGPTVERDYKIRQKAKTLPGKLIHKVRILSKANNLSERHTYRIITNK
jgi:hypothetical protein